MLLWPRQTKECKWVFKFICKRFEDTVIRYGISVDDQWRWYESTDNQFYMWRSSKSIHKRHKRSQNAYFACEQCETEGDYSHISHTVFYSKEYPSLKRTNKWFRNRRQIEQQNFNSKRFTDWYDIAIFFRLYFAYNALDE